jgi:hypothetical protein
MVLLYGEAFDEKGEAQSPESIESDLLRLRFPTKGDGLCKWAKDPVDSSDRLYR